MTDADIAAAESYDFYWPMHADDIAAPDAPPRVADQCRYWGERPRVPSLRCIYWAARIRDGWRPVCSCSVDPATCVACAGYDERAEFYGVWIWEEGNVLQPMVRGEPLPAYITAWLATGVTSATIIYNAAAPPPTPRVLAPTARIPLHVIIPYTLYRRFRIHRGKYAAPIAAAS